MGLPKIKQPVFTMTLPSTKKAVRYRPFTVAEEKLVLIAKEGDLKDTINVYKQIINNCCLDQIDVDKMASFDIEYFFINIRAKSVSNIIEATIKDHDDGATYPITIDLDKIKVTESKHSNNIKLTDSIGVVLRYPTFEALTTIETTSVGQENKVMSLMASCIEQIYEGSEVYEVSNYTRSELEEFVSSLGMKELGLIKDFIEDMPKVYVDVTYKTSAGKEKSIKLEGLQSFFV